MTTHTVQCWTAWLVGKYNMKKLSVSLSGHQTSVSLEDEFLSVLREIAKKRKMSVAALVAEIDDSRKLGDNLSSAIRVWILNYLRKQF